MNLKTFTFIGIALTLAALFFFGGYFVSSSRSHHFNDRKNDLLREADIEKDHLLSVAGCHVFLGDSLINMGQWSEYFPEQKVCERGYNGATSKDILSLSKALAAEKPAKVTLLVGINDIMQGIAADAACSTIEDIIGVFAAKDIPVHVIVPFPSIKYGKLDLRKGAQDLDTCLTAQRTPKGPAVIHDLSEKLLLKGQLNPDFTVDGVHLNGAGYAALSQALQNDSSY